MAKKSTRATLPTATSPTPSPRRNRVPKRKARPGVDQYGRTPLWLAASNGDVAAVQRELAAGADPNQGDDDGFTPLHVSAQNGRPAVTELLLENGADPNRTDHHGNGPLWTASHFAGIVAGNARHVAVLALLLGGGADLDAKNRYGRSARDVIIRSALDGIIVFCKPWPR